MLADMARYSGRCHCGAVQFEIESDLSDPILCNCSICIRRAAVMVYVEPEDFTLLAGADQLVHYGFRSDSPRCHSFCKTCGIFPFFNSTWQGHSSYAVNLGCLEGVNVYNLSPRLIDGASYR